MNALLRPMAVWRARSLRFQIAALICGTGVILLLLNAALLTVFLDRYALEHEGSALSDRVTAMATCVPGSTVLTVLAADRPVASNDVEIIPATAYEDAMIVDRGGVILLATPMKPSLRATFATALRGYLARSALSASGAAQWHTLDGEIVAAAVVRCHGITSPSLRTSSSTTDLRGALLLAEDMSVADSAWRQLLERVFLAGVIAIGMAVVIGLVVGDTATRAARSVTRAARAIAAGDWRRRVVPAGPAEMREMASAFNGMVDEVVRRRRIERDLLANISHELGSPLAVIRGYSEALVDNILTKESDRVDALRAIHAESLQLERLTADLLDLALLETGQVSLHLEDVPVRDLLLGLGQRLMPVMKHGDLTLSVEAPDNLPVLYTDGQRLEQILVNLLTNASRHTPPGGSITMSGKRDGDGVSITVRDTGSGIAAEDLPRIWERFYQAEKGRDRRSHQTGAGLGLDICASTARLLQGSIDVESTVGVGTAFTVRLPLRIEEQTTVERLSGM